MDSGLAETTRQPYLPAPEVVALARAAAAASELDLVGVDLLPQVDGWVVLELNGAVDFTRDYAPESNVFAAAIAALARVAEGRRDPLPAAVPPSAAVAEPV